MCALRMRGVVIASAYMKGAAKWPMYDTSATVKSAAESPKSQDTEVTG
jgi:hypothetical protein